MNPPAVGGAAYAPTTLEHWANVLSHAVAIPPSLWLAWLLADAASQYATLDDDKGYVSLASGGHRSTDVDPMSTDAIEPPSPDRHGSTVRWQALVVYGVALVALFSVSTVFHVVALWGHSRLLHCTFHRLDRAMIYVFIASSYTPWLLLKTLNGPAQDLRWGIWVVAGLGIAYQQAFHERYKLLDTLCYVCVGVAPALALLGMTDPAGVWELKVGGAIYLVGVVFFKMDGRLPMAHAIWHLHVVAGSYVHYTAVAAYLAPPPPSCSAHPQGVCPTPIVAAP